MTNEIKKQIELANEVKNRFGYFTQAVVVKRFYTKTKYAIGFIFDDTKSVGDVFLNGSNEKCEVLAIS